MSTLPTPYLARLQTWIRAQFPQVETLRDGRRRIYLDNAAGTLVPRTVAEAMAEAALWENPQPSRAWPPAPGTQRLHRETRALLADFLNADDGDRLFFSESATACLYKLREGLEPGWAAGDNLVVTDCDHFSNISAWERRPRGWETRRARMLPDGGLDLDHLADLVDEQTRVVAITLASNGLGTIVDVPGAVARVRERAPGALVVVDAVHAAPHLPLDVRTLGADALVFSTYKLFGPMGGVLWLREGLLERLSPYRVEPHTDAETLLEWGTLNNVDVAGARAALEYLQKLGERLEPAFVGRLSKYPRPRRLFKVALEAIREHEGEFSRRVLAALSGSDVTLYGVADAERWGERVPTFAFSVPRVADAELEARLWESAGLQVAVGSHYSAAVTRGLGRAQVARASFAHYNMPEEAECLARELRALSADG